MDFFVTYIMCCIVFLGVFGSLDMHGTNRSVYWTKLAEPADVGTSSITLIEAVSVVKSIECCYITVH